MSVLETIRECVSNDNHDNIDKMRTAVALITVIVTPVGRVSEYELKRRASGSSITFARSRLPD